MIESSLLRISIARRTTRASWQAPKGGEHCRLSAWARDKPQQTEQTLEHRGTKRLVVLGNGWAGFKILKAINDEHTT